MPFNIENVKRFLDDNEPLPFVWKILSKENLRDNIKIVTVGFAGRDADPSECAAERTVVPFYGMKAQIFMIGVLSYPREHIVHRNW